MSEIYFSQGPTYYGCPHTGMIPAEEWPGCPTCDAKIAALFGNQPRPVVTSIDHERGVVTYDSGGLEMPNDVIDPRKFEIGMKVRRIGETRRGTVVSIELLKSGGSRIGVHLDGDNARGKMEASYTISHTMLRTPLG